MVDFTLKTHLEKRLKDIDDVDVSHWPIEMRCLIHDMVTEAKIGRSSEHCSMIGLYTIIKKLENLLKTEGDSEKFSALVNEVNNGE